MTDAQYLAWLNDPSAIRIVLIEVGVNTSGVETTRYLGTGWYVTSPTDTPPNQPYDGIVNTGVTFTEELSLTSDGSISTGDIEIDNFTGERDNWFDDVWDNRPIKAFIGDPRWARTDFRMIFNGIVASMESTDRSTINLVMRDKLQRLNTALMETKLGGTTTNKDSLLPVLFGEGHNISPLLSNPVTLEYTVHSGPVEEIVEVRDNGLPVSVVINNATGKFTLNQQSAGTITVSARGDNTGSYRNTISSLVQRIVTGYGKSTDRFTAEDLDAANLAAFESAHPQPVGAYFTDTTNVLAACQMLTSSVGAQIIMSRLGLLRIIQLQVPGAGTPIVVQPHQMVEKSLKVVQRPSVVAAVKLGFNKNWTVQESLQTAIPAAHADLYATEWLTSTQVDTAVQTLYKLNAEPTQVDTMLLRRVEADAEATRQLNLWKVQRRVFEVELTADMLLLLELGSAITIYNDRFGLKNGGTGIVTSLAPDWLTGRVTAQILI